MCVLTSLTKLENRIESMKMETIIRSPQNGVVAKMVHKEGVSSVVTCAIDWMSNALNRIFVKLVLSLCCSKKYVTINFTLTTPCLRHKLKSIELGRNCSSIVNIRQSHQGIKPRIYLEKRPFAIAWCSVDQEVWEPNSKK